MTGDIGLTSPFPTGVLTFLMSDVAGSTRLWESHPQAMRDAMRRHRDIVVSTVEKHRGVLPEEQGEGDSSLAAFVGALDAVECALDIQRTHAAEDWPEPVSILLRIGLHTGEAELRDPRNYFGPTLNRAARLRDLASGGQVLVSQTTAVLVSDRLPSGATLQDLGRHRLKDLSRAEQVFQLGSAGLPADFPPLRSLDLLPHNLPVQLTSFIGREEEMGAVCKLLAATRIVTLTGVGGAGKTRLALQVGAQLLDEHRDGVWFVDLGAVSDPDMVAPTVAVAVGLRQQAGNPMIGAAPQTRELELRLTDHLRARELLVVLDNCEQVVSACARLAAVLLRSCPGLHILATSREPLGVHGEATWRLPPLAFPDSEVPLAADALSGFEAVRLFVDRATLVRPGFRLDEPEARAVAEICRRLDGVPLAIELAAPWVRLLSCTQIASRLEDRLELLHRRGRGEPERQQSLRASLEWSHEMLSPPERTLLRRLSIFTGSFSLEGVEAICAGDGVEQGRVLETLSQLVDRSLVVVDEDGDTIRYRLLQIVREYGRERLDEAEERQEITGRFIRYYLNLGERSEPVLRAPGSYTPRVAAELSAELDNIRAVLLLTLAQRPRQAVQLAGAVAPLWPALYRGEEGLRWLEQSLAAADDAHPIARARALVYASSSAWGQGDSESARRFAEESLAISRETGIPTLLGYSLVLLGYVNRYQGNFGEARVFLEDALAAFREAGDKGGIHFALLHLGAVAWGQGETEASRAFLEECLAVARETGSPSQTAWALNYMSMTATDEQSARALLDESLSLFRDAGDDFSSSWTQMGIAWLELNHGNAAEAASLFEEALGTFRRQRNEWSVAFALLGLGGCATRAGDFAGGRRLLGESLEIAARMGEDGAMARGLTEFTLLEVSEKNFEAAARLVGVLDERLERAKERSAFNQLIREFDEARAAARTSLGEARFEELVEEGRKMTLREGAELVLKAAAPS